MPTLPQLPIFSAIAQHNPSSVAIVHHPSNRSFTYGQLLHDVATTSAQQPIPPSSRIAFLCEHSYDYVITLLSAFASHSIALPLCPTFPPSELRYALNNSEASTLLASAKYASLARDVLRDGIDKAPALKSIEKRQQRSHHVEPVTLERPSGNGGGLMLYTSGTTSQPKGVLLPQSSLTAQCQSLAAAWRYSLADRLLHVLPLHHIHGTVNALLTPLLAGSTIEFMFPFNVDAVWQRFAAPFVGEKSLDEKITFFTVVPTIYNRLLSSHSELSPEMQAATRESLSPENLRLNISGSAALPTPTKSAWTELSKGNVLLERYGMTEVGMALSCGLSFADRVDGSVGWPLPGVEARLVETDTNEVIQPGDEMDAEGKEREGEIQLRGETVFKEYWRNPKATQEEFVKGDDGQGKWFRTGDVAVRRKIEGAGENDQPWAKGSMYFIRGRKSVDIIKTGGEKVSALEIEREMLSLPQVAEVAVVGIDNEAWGQKVAAIVVLDSAHADSGRGGKKWGSMDMRRALKDKLANYKIPQEMKVIKGSLPRNAMGKINKKALVKEIFG